MFPSNNYPLLLFPSWHFHWLLPINYPQVCSILKRTQKAETIPPNSSLPSLPHTFFLSLLPVTTQALEITVIIFCNFLTSLSSQLTAICFCPHLSSETALTQVRNCCHIAKSREQVLISYLTWPLNIWHCPPLPSLLEASLPLPSIRPHVPPIVIFLNL